MKPGRDAGKATICRRGVVSERALTVQMSGAFALKPVTASMERCSTAGVDTL
jgi:hypothetical protein